MRCPAAHIAQGLPMTRSQFAVACLAVFAASPLLAQDELRLRQKLEGRRVVLQIDMPATSEGVDVHPGSSRPVDFGKYSGRLKSHGVSIRSGESSMITKVKVKDDMIEIHLGGGGYGTAGDAFGSLFKNTGADSGVAQQAKIANERTQRAASGSRFNLRYANGLAPEDLRAESVAQALQEFASFPTLTKQASSGAIEEASASATSPATKPAAQPAVSTTSAAQPSASGLPRKGMSPEDVERLAGKPTSSKTVGQIVTHSYSWPDGVLEADFYNGVLVGYRIKSS